MIRPFTCVCMMLAAGSGLYLYQAKHQAQMLDRQIDQIERGTTETRARIGVLRAEFALLNDPTRLQELASAHLPGLSTLQPGQFTTLAELDGRLPPVGAPPAPPVAPSPPLEPAATTLSAARGAPIAPAPTPVAVIAGAAAASGSMGAVPPLAPAAAAPVPVARAASPRRPKSVVLAAIQATRRPPAGADPFVTPAVSPALVVSRGPAFAATPTARPAATVPTAQIGSALGMARGLATATGAPAWLPASATGLTPR